MVDHTVHGLMVDHTVHGLMTDSIVLVLKFGNIVHERMVLPYSVWTHG